VASRCHGDNASRRKRTHCQPYGGRAGSAVVTKATGLLAQILNVAARVGGVITSAVVSSLSFFSEKGAAVALVGNVWPPI